MGPVGQYHGGAATVVRIAVTQERRHELGQEIGLALGGEPNRAEMPHLEPLTQKTMGGTGTPLLMSRAVKRDRS